MSILMLMAVLSQAPSSRPAPTPTSESSRLAGEYFVQKQGATWNYAAAKGGRAHYSITAFVDWRATFSFSLGKRTAAGHWRVKDGTWFEKSPARGDVEAVLLPAVMTRGTRWVTFASLERGKLEQSQYEVLALDAQVELPTGMTVDHCLAVYESALDGTDGYTHYYAPNVGKVAVRGPDDWLFRLTDFNPGQRGHAE